MNFLKYRGSEDGFYLPLLAVCAFGLISTLIVLGLNTFIVRTAKYKISRSTKQVCEEVISSEFFNFGSVAIRKLGLRTKKLFLQHKDLSNYIYEIKPFFLVPGMPNNSWFETRSNDLKSFGSNGISFSKLGFPGCQDGNFLKPCLLYSAPSYFPKDLISPGNFKVATSARNTVVCAVKAKVNRYFLEDIEIKASFAFKKEILGFFPNDYRKDLKKRNFSEQRGIVLAISPHLTTNIDSEKFKFSSTFPDSLGEIFNPLHNFSSRIFNRVPEISNDITNVQRYSVGGVVKSLKAPDLISNQHNSALKNSENDSATKHSDTSKGSDYEQFLSACMNPLILARNAFLVTLTEFFVRHADFRSSTEILMIGTKHRHSNSTVNQPVKLVSFGSDLLRPDLDQNLNGTGAPYQLPYVSYYRKTNGIYKNNPGYVDPFNTTSKYSSYDALVSGQLRFCNHLYSCNGNLPDINCSGRLSRYSLSLIHDLKVESDDYQATLALRPKISSNNWDQHCAFGVSPNCDKGGGAIVDRPHFGGVNAIELLAMLGSVQSCPYEKYDPDIFSAEVCKKPGYNSNSSVNESLDLQPDYLGLISYLNGSLNSVSSPGIWNLKATNFEEEPFDSLTRPDVYQSAINFKTPVVIVTHQLPASYEVKPISDILANNLAWRERPITIVYMPYISAQEVEKNGIDRFKKAFKIDDPNFNNSLYVFSPLEAELALSDENYRDYWQALVYPDNVSFLEADDTINFKALSVFNLLLSKPKQIF